MRHTAFPSRRRIVLAFFVLFLTAPAWAADSPSARATLKGITEIKVVVEKLPPDVEEDGLTVSQLQTDIELRLRQSGIKVVPSAEPYLYVNVNTSKSKTVGLYAFRMDVEFKQSVSLIRNPAILYGSATTWSTGGVGTIGTQLLREIRSYLNDLVE